MLEDEEEDDSAAEGVAAQLAGMDAVGTPLEFWTEAVGSERAQQGSGSGGAGRGGSKDVGGLVSVKQQPGEALASKEDKNDEQQSLEGAGQGGKRGAVERKAAAKKGRGLGRSSDEAAEDAAAQRQRRKKDALAGRGARKGGRRKAAEGGAGSALAALKQGRGAKQGPRPVGRLEAAAKKHLGRQGRAVLALPGRGEAWAEGQLLQDRQRQRSLASSSSSEGALPFAPARFLHTPADMVTTVGAALKEVCQGLGYPQKCSGQHMRHAPHCLWLMIQS